MLSLLFNPLVRLAIGVTVIAAVLGLGWGYISNLRSENALLARQVSAYKRTVEILKKDVQIDQELQDDIDAISRLNTPGEFDNMFRKLRERAANSGGRDSSHANHQ